MWSVKGVVLLIVFSTTYMSVAPTVVACECPDTSAPPACALFWRSQIVFTATVKEISPKSAENSDDPSRASVRLSVQKVFKGAIDKEVLDIQGEDRDCHSIYQLGRQYLIYADAYDRASNMVKTALCFGRGELSHSVEELKYIDRLNNHLAKSSISGRVLESKYKPLPALRVVVEGMGKTYMTCTDQNGKYEISVDQPGKYVVTLVGQFSAATFSYGAEGYTRTSSGIQYKLDFVNGQCDYREVTVFQTY